MFCAIQLLVLLLRAIDFLTEDALVFTFEELTQLDTMNVANLTLSAYVEVGRLAFKLLVALLIYSMLLLFDYNLLVLLNMALTFIDYTGLHEQTLLILPEFLYTESLAAYRSTYNCIGWLCCKR